MHHLNPSKTALVCAVFAGSVHALWALLVALKLAQPFTDFLLWSHMLALAYVVKPFDPAAALASVAITAFIGYLIGYFFSKIWNRMHR
jgi:hypothetical protein